VVHVVLRCVGCVRCVIGARRSGAAGEMDRRAPHRPPRPRSGSKHCDTRSPTGRTLERPPGRRQGRAGLDRRGRASP